MSRERLLSPRQQGPNIFSPYFWTKCSLHILWVLSIQRGPYQGHCHHHCGHQQLWQCVRDEFVPLRNKMRVTHNIVFVIIIIDLQSDGSSLVINYHLQMDAWWRGMAAWSELPRRSCCCLLPLGSLYREPFSKMIARMMTMTMMMIIWHWRWW